MIKYEYELMALYRNAIEDEEEWLKKEVSKKDKVLLESLLSDINEIGYNIKYFSDFRFRKFDDKKIIPILKEYIGEFDNDGISSELISVMGQKGWNECTEFILEQLYKIENIEELNNSYIFVSINNALYKIKDKRYIKEYIKIIENPKLAKEMFLVVWMLGRWQVEEAKKIYLNYLKTKDIELVFMTIRALSYYKDEKIINHIEPFLNWEDKDMRKSAEKAINRIKKNVLKGQN